MITIGADPEFFLKKKLPPDREVSPPGEFQQFEAEDIVASIGIVPGTKEEPFSLTPGEELFCHEDNVCVEIGFSPCTDAREFSDKLEMAKKLVTEQFLGKKFTLSAFPSYLFREDQLTSTQASEFGCDPDFDAYIAGKVRKRPERLHAFLRHRTAGGHIHIGGKFNCPPFVAALFADIYLGILPMHAGYTDGLVTSTDARAEWYGKAGIFRPKPYGIEYRTPSNWWCLRTRNMRQMGQMALDLGRYLENTSALTLRGAVSRLPWAEIQLVLNTHTTMAKKDVTAKLAEIMELSCKIGLPI